MKKIFIFIIAIFMMAIGNTGYSQIPPIINNGSQWKTVRTSLNGEVDYITKQDNVIYYVVDGQINKIENDIDRPVWRFPVRQTIIQIYPPTSASQLIIVTDENIFEVNINGNTEVLYTVPMEYGDNYKIRRSFIKNDEIVILMSGTHFTPWSARAYLLALNNQGQVHTLYESVNNFLGQIVHIYQDTVSIEGPAYGGPCHYNLVRKETLIWNEGDTEFNFVSFQETSNMKFLYIENSNLLLTSEPFYTLSCSSVGVEKYIKGNGEPYKYYSHHDSIYYSIGGHGGGWIPAETFGVDFQPLGGIKIGNNVLFYGPITSDLNGNYTSVRLYSLSDRNFQDIGRGLDAITTAWYGGDMIRGQEDVILGARDKIYIKRNKVVDPAGLQNGPDKILLSNYPNPFNPTTRIQYTLPHDSKVSLSVYDISGREVIKLVDEVKVAGNYSVEFNGNNLSSGAYYYRFTAGTFTETKKMMLIK